MRENWGSFTDNVALTLAQLSELIQPAFPGQTVVEAATAQGGLANTNVRLRLSGREEPILLRLFVRDPKEAPKEVALNRLVAGSCPVPAFLHFAENNPVTGQAYILMDWVDGVRLEVAAKTLTDDQLNALGRDIGRVLAGIHGITFPETGFFDADLNISTPISVGRDGLVWFLRHCLADGLGEKRIGADLTQAAIAFVETEGRLLDGWQGPACLAHCDFNGSNILVREIEGAWCVAAVLDWEFAISGSPFFDFGNLLRPPLGERSGFEESVAGGYREAGGVLPDEWRAMSRLIDLTAWADFLNRPNATDGLIRDAAAMIEQTINRTM